MSRPWGLWLPSKVRQGACWWGTAKVEDGHVYVSTDDGSNWSIASNLSTFGGAPIGQTVLQLGVNSTGQSAKVLCYGHPDYMMGVWLGSAAGV
jgi:hypothetical protein